MLVSLKKKPANRRAYKIFAFTKLGSRFETAAEFFIYIFRHVTIDHRH